MIVLNLLLDIFIGVWVVMGVCWGIVVVVELVVVNVGFGKMIVIVLKF